MFGQRERRRFDNFEMRLPFYSEEYVIPADSIDYVYFTYRLPYSSLVFIKADKKYSASFSIAVEANDSASGKIIRQTDQKNILASNFEQTNSKDLFVQGVLFFKLKSGKSVLTPTLTDLNSGNEYEAPPSFNNKISYHKLGPPQVRFYSKSKGDNTFLAPIVVNSKKYKDSYVLTNYEGEIPFSEDEYYLIIPCKQKSLKNIFIKIISGKDTVLSNKVDKSFISGICFRNEDGNIILSNDSTVPQTRNFILENFSRKLLEGGARLIISGTSNFNKTKETSIGVTWFDKPFSLRNPEEAIRILSAVENENVVDSLLSAKSNEYGKVLFNYWKRFDPTPSSAFNPLMNEFYERVDYAKNNFSPLSKDDGAATDRGKIYIKYGKPTSIQRTYNQYGRSVQIWHYKKLSKVFEFVDPRGTGNYILARSNG